MYTVDLIVYIFTQIIDGVNFLPVAESISAMHVSRYVKDAGDINVANFSNNTIYSYPSPDGIEATFLDIFNDLRDEFCGILALPAKSISVDHTFKVGKPIGGHREQDNKFIKSYKKLFTILNEEGAVVAWELTNSTSLDEIEPVLNGIELKLKNNQISYIYTDTCCGFKKVYEQCFPGVPIKLDLFHATHRITKTLPDKKFREAIDFSRCFGFVFRNSFDTGDTRNQITEGPATITRNIDGFMRLKGTYIKELPVNRRNDLLSEIENLKKHVEKGCVSGIPPGGGTENNERLHRYFNRSFLRGATCLSVEVAKAVLTVLFYVYNSCIINGKKGKVAFYTPLPLQKSSTNDQFNKSIDFTGNEQNIKTDTDYIVEIRQSVMQLYNAIQSVRGKCIRRGFLAEDFTEVYIISRKANKYDQSWRESSSQSCCFSI